MSQESFSDPARLAQQLLAAANSLTDEEASQRYRQILSQLPREEAAQLNALALTQVAPDQRRVLASGLKQAHNDPGSSFDGYDDDDDDVAATPQRLGQMSAKAAQQDPALVNNLFGGENSGLGGQIGKAALAALAAMLLRNLMSGQGQQPSGGYGGVGQGAPGGMDPVTMILGSLLGGAGGGQMGGQMGGGGSYGGQPPAGDLGSILGGLLGGAKGGQTPRGQTPGGQAPAGAGGLDLGSILSTVLNQAGGQQGGAGGQTQGGPDLGSILGSILGGGPQSHRKE